MRTDSSYKAVTASGDTGLQVITGWQFTENGAPGGAARVLLREGVGGPIFADIRLVAGESAGDNYDYPIVLSQTNTGAKCYAEVATGTVRGAVYGR